MKHLDPKATTTRRMKASISVLLVVAMTGVLVAGTTQSAEATGTETTTMEPPYAKSGIWNACGIKVNNICAPSLLTMSDHTTGRFRAEAAATPGFCGVGCRPSSGAIAWIEAVHELTAPASTIDYEVSVDIGSGTALSTRLQVRAFARRTGCCSSGWTTHNFYFVPAAGTSVTLPFKLTVPDGIIPAGFVRIHVDLYAMAGGELSIGGFADAQAQVSSITATASGTESSMFSIQLDAPGRVGIGYGSAKRQAATGTWCASADNVL